MSEPSTPAPHHQRVGWLELFYDLVFVVVIERLTHLVHDNPSPGLTAATVGLCAVVWFAWFNATALTNMVVGVRGRPCYFVSMSGVGLMALGVHGAAHGHPMLFALGYALARTALLPLTWPWLREHRSQWTRSFVAGPLLSLAWVAAGFMHTQYGWAFAALVIAEMSLSTLRPSGPDTVGPRIDGPHMIERIGLFLMIVLGESVVQIINALDTERTPMHWVTAALAMTLLCALWWLVYDACVAKIEEATERTESNALDFVGGSQLMIAAGLVLVAGGLSAAIHHADPASGGAHIPHGSLVALCIGILMVTFGVSSLSRRALAARLGLPGPEQRRAAQEDRARGVTARHLFGWALHLATSVAPVVIVLTFGAHWAPWVVLLVLVAFISLSIIGPARREADIERYVAAGGTGDAREWRTR